MDSLFTIYSPQFTNEAFTLCIRVGRMSLMTTCDSCNIRLGPQAFSSQDKLYCCAGCAAGGPCLCSYQQDLGRYPPAHYARPVSLPDLLDQYEREIQRKFKGNDVVKQDQSIEERM